MAVSYAIDYRPHLGGRTTHRVATIRIDNNIVTNILIEDTLPTTETLGGRGRQALLERLLRLLRREAPIYPTALPSTFGPHVSVHKID